MRTAEGHRGADRVGGHQDCSSGEEASDWGSLCRSELKARTLRVSCQGGFMRITVETVTLVYLVQSELRDEPSAGIAREK